MLLTIKVHNLALIFITSEETPWHNFDTVTRSVCGDCPRLRVAVLVSEVLPVLGLYRFSVKEQSSVAAMCSQSTCECLSVCAGSHVNMSRRVNIDQSPRG